MYHYLLQPVKLIAIVIDATVKLIQSAFVWYNMKKIVANRMRER